MTLSGFFGFSQQPRHIAHEDQASRPQRDRHLGRGHVRIAIVDVAILVRAVGLITGVMPCAMQSSRGAVFTSITSPT